MPVGDIQSLIGVVTDLQRQQQQQQAPVEGQAGSAVDEIIKRISDLKPEKKEAEELGPLREVLVGLASAFSNYAATSNPFTPEGDTDFLGDFNQTAQDQADRFNEAERLKFEDSRSALGLELQRATTLEGDAITEKLRAEKEQRYFVERTRLETVDARTATQENLRGIEDAFINLGLQAGSAGVDLGEFPRTRAGLSSATQAIGKALKQQADQDKSNDVDKESRRVSQDLFREAQAIVSGGVTSDGVTPVEGAIGQMQKAESKEEAQLIFSQALDALDGLLINPDMTSRARKSIESIKKRLFSAARSILAGPLDDSGDGAGGGGNREADGSLSPFGGVLKEIFRAQPREGKTLGGILGDFGQRD